jgi:hypothetical protein
VLDPCLVNLNFLLQCTNVCHPALVLTNPQRQMLKLVRPAATVASIQHQSDKQDHALLDSGNTDSVTNDTSLFVSLQPTSMNLIVASTDWFPVKQMEDVILPTLQGPLRVSDVLYCPNIKGTIVFGWQVQGERRTAKKPGSDGCIRVYIGCGHPIQTWARATE